MNFHNKKTVSTFFCQQTPRLMLTRIPMRRPNSVKCLLFFWVLFNTNYCCKKFSLCERERLWVPNNNKKQRMNFCDYILTHTFSADFAVLIRSIRVGINQWYGCAVRCTFLRYLKNSPQFADSSVWFLFVVYTLFLSLFDLFWYTTFSKIRFF